MTKKIHGKTVLSKKSWLIATNNVSVFQGFFADLFEFFTDSPKIATKIWSDSKVLYSLESLNITKIIIIAIRLLTGFVFNFVFDLLKIALLVMMGTILFSIPHLLKFIKIKTVDKTVEYFSNFVFNIEAKVIDQNKAMRCLFDSLSALQVDPITHKLVFSFNNYKKMIDHVCVREPDFVILAPLVEITGLPYFFSISRFLLRYFPDINKGIQQFMFYPIVALSGFFNFLNFIFPTQSAITTAVNQSVFIARFFSIYFSFSKVYRIATSFVEQAFMNKNAAATIEATKKENNLKELQEVSERNLLERAYIDKFSVEPHKMLLNGIFEILTFTVMPLLNSIPFRKTSDIAFKTSLYFNSIIAFGFFISFIQRKYYFYRSLLDQRFLVIMKSFEGQRSSSISASASSINETMILFNRFYTGIKYFLFSMAFLNLVLNIEYSFIFQLLILPLSPFVNWTGTQATVRLIIDNLRGLISNTSTEATAIATQKTLFESTINNFFKILASSKYRDSGKNLISASSSTAIQLANDSRITFLDNFVFNLFFNPGSNIYYFMSFFDSIWFAYPRLMFKISILSVYIFCVISSILVLKLFLKNFVSAESEQELIVKITHSFSLMLLRYFFLMSVLLGFVLYCIFRNLNEQSYFFGMELFMSGLFFGILNNTNIEYESILKLFFLLAQASIMFFIKFWFKYMASSFMYKIQLSSIYRLGYENFCRA